LPTAAWVPDAGLALRRAYNERSKWPLSEVKVPQLSESVAEGVGSVQWKKKPGEAVAIDEILVEIETDKVVLEVPAPAAGVFAQVLKQDGETCVAEEVIAKIDTEAVPSAAGSAAAAPSTAAAPAAAPASAAAAAPSSSTASTAGVAPSPAPAGPASGVAMPAAAKLMADHQLSADAVSGTGKAGA
jgi:2-oxoglutarate dehydrogenase E2 component (dihydrolipoamide succinyltransferase)